MVAADHTRDPCPWVILNDTGAAFAMGAIGGSLWHGIKGSRNSPRGERLPAALAAIKQRGPTLGGAFGMWGAVFGTSDCIVRSVRQTEDMKNGVIAGFMTGAALAVRSGPKMMLGSGIMCGILLGVMEGMGVLMQRMFAGQNKQVAPVIPDTVPGQA